MKLIRRNNMKKSGVALVTTIMIILLLSLLAAGMMFTIKSETAISVYQASSVQVVAVAESALDEIKHRMNLEPDDPLFIGDVGVPLTTTWTTYITFGTLEEDDSTAHIYYKNSLQNDLDSIELDYTTEDFDSNLSLVVHHKLSEDSTQIYFFDSKTQKQFLGPPSLVTEYPPVEVVEITARSGKALKKILAEISKQEVNIKVQSALSAATIVLQSTGNVDPYVCGHNHRMDTPFNVCPLAPGASLWPAPGFTGAPTTCWDDSLAGTASQQIGPPKYHVNTPYDSTYHPSYNHYYWNPVAHGWAINRIEYDEYCSRVGCLAGIATTSANLSSFGASMYHIFGNPDIIVKYSIVIPELYELLGFSSESEMNDNIPWNDVTTLPNDPDSVRYYRITPATGTWTGIPTGTQTKGIIWVKGDIDFHSGNGYSQHKGLLYVEGNWTGNVAGTVDVWILGAMVIKGFMDVHATGNARIFFMYSSEALKQTVESDLEFFKLLGWKEIN